MNLCSTITIELSHQENQNEISDISLEYEIATHPDLASHISGEYQNMALLYDRVLITDKFQWISRTRHETGHLICLVNP